MAAEKTFKQRFAEIYPQIYLKLISDNETFDEELWQVGLTTEVSLGEETLTAVQKDFFTAIRAADVDTVKSIIRCETAKPHFKLSVLLPSLDYWQTTNPLHPAQPYFSEDIQVVIWNLIISTIEKNNCEELLRWAIVFYQSDDVIRKFIDRIKALDSVDAERLTFLHLACVFNQETTVESLLAKNANPQIGDSDGNLPLHYACANNHPGIVRLLLNSMKDKSCIAELLQEGAIHSGKVKQLLIDAYSAPSIRQVPKAPPTPLAQFVAKNGLHKKKPVYVIKNTNIELLPDINLVWEARVAEAESKQKKTKTLEKK